MFAHATTWQKVDLVGGTVHAVERKHTGMDDQFNGVLSRCLYPLYSRSMSPSKYQFFAFHANK